MRIFEDAGLGGLLTVAGLLLALLGLYYASKRNRWLFAVFTVIGLFVGIVIGVDYADRKPTTSFQKTVRVESTNPIQMIDFDYPDSLLNHGWTLKDGDERNLVINHISDNLVGSAVAISSTDVYGLDFPIGLEAKQNGKVIEFVATFQDNGYVYAFVELARDDGTTKTGWLKLGPGEVKPAAVSLGMGTGEDEWLVPLKPILSLGLNWIRYQIDLEDAVDNTFGVDGWKFQRLNKVRIRGKLSLDYIAVLRKQP